MESDDGHSLKLTWTDHAKNVSIAFIDLLEQKEFIDVTLSADGHMFSAHRLILSAVSPHFRQMLNKVPANQQAFGKKPLFIMILIRVFVLFSICNVFFYNSNFEWNISSNGKIFTRLHLSWRSEH